MDDDSRRLPDQATGEDASGETKELAAAMVQIYKRQFGRGPTRSHAAYANKDLLICTLEDSLTPAEKRMAEMNEHQRLRDIRMFFQHACGTEFTTTVEDITGRKVRAFVSGLDTNKDVSSEVFY